MIALSRRESLVLGLIQIDWEAHGETPTVMELSRRAKIEYRHVVNTLQSLHDIGFIELDYTARHVEYAPLWWE